MAVHVARIGLVNVDNTGNVYTRDSNRTIAQSLVFEKQHRILEDPTIPNTANNPTLDEYLALEDAAGLHLTHLDQYVVVTTDVTISIGTGDIEIGAVEIKNGDSDQRAVVNIDGELLVYDECVCTNTGTIVTNTGTIATNTGTIATNTGTIVTNTGIIATNTGTIATNTTNIPNVIGTVDGAAPSRRIIIAGVAESSVPTEVADGDVVDLYTDTFGRLVIKGYDAAADAIGIVDTSPAVFQTIEETFTQLTAPGTTVSINTQSYKNITFQYVIATIDTNVVVRAEGSLDNTSWFNLNDARVDTTETSNGTYMMHKDNFKCKYVRFNFVSELGGTNATIDVKLIAGN